jgi:SAM-dependent methyltransferase
MFAPTMPKLQTQPTARFDLDAFESHIRTYAHGHPGTLRILEAGCGRRWYLDLVGIDFHLAGVDLNSDSMRIRTDQFGDLDEAIVGDLREISLLPDFYDVIYCSFVLEHVAGAEQVLDRLLSALKPDGILLLRIPDGDSVYGFLARHSPHWLHVQYKRRIQRNRLAGTPGRGPFPTVYDQVVSWRGMTAYCARHGMEIVDAYSSNFYLDHFRGFAAIVDHGLRWAARVSGGRLTADHNNLALVIRKPFPQPERAEAQAEPRVQPR